MHVLPISKETLHEVFQYVGSQLTIVIRHINNLVLSKLNGTTLVGVDMSGVDRYHTLIGVEYRVDNGGIGLRTSRHKEYVGIIVVACCHNLSLGFVAINVEAIATRMFVVCLDKSLQYLWVCTVVVVTFKRNHAYVVFVYANLQYFFRIT